MGRSAWLQGAVQSAEKRKCMDSMRVYVRRQRCGEDLPLSLSSSPISFVPANNFDQVRPRCHC